MKIPLKLEIYPDKAWLWRSLGRGMLGTLLVFSVACQSSSSSQTETPTPSPTPDLESRLTLNNATLEQSNIKGEMLWKIQVEEADYSADQETAYLTNVKGNIFESGKIVLQISANKGEIQRNGENIVLKQNVIAVDPRNKAIMRSEEVEWQPEASLLIVKQRLKGSDPNLDVLADRGEYNAKIEQLVLKGNIVATTRDPKLQLKTEEIVWQVPQKRVMGNKPLKMVRFDGETITDKLSAGRAIVQLDSHTVTIHQNIEYNSLEPPLQIASHWIHWQYKDRIVSTNQPIQLLHTPDQVTLTGNQGVANLATKLIHLHGGVRGNSPNNGGKLYSDTLTYDMPNQAIAAVGNVIYEQTKPPFNLTGTQAFGLIQGQKITNLVVTSDSQDRVVTEFYPEDN